MTKKRFKCTNISTNGMTGLFWLGKDNLSVYDVLRILNDLLDENEQLKKRIEYLERKIQRERKSAIKEHEKWEKEVIELIREQRKFVDDLSKENDHLKQRINELELLNDGLNYALQNIKKIDVEIDLNE